MTASPALAEPNIWTTPGGYQVQQPGRAAVPGRVPAPPNWASPDAYRVPTKGNSNKILHGLGRTTGMVYNEFALIADAERANQKSRAYARSLGRILSGGSAAGGRWGNVIARAGKYGRAAGKAVAWLGGAVVLYEIWNLAFGDAGDVVAPASPDIEESVPELPTLTAANVRAAAPLIMSAKLINGYNYPLVSSEAAVIGYFGIANLANKPFILVAAPGGGGITGTYFHVVRYTKVADTTPLKGLGGCVLTSYEVSGYRFRNYTGNCYQVVSLDVGRYRRDSAIVDSWPGRTSTTNNFVQQSGVAPGAPTHYDDPLRAYYVGAPLDLQEVPLRAPAQGDQAVGSPNDDMKVAPFHPDALKSIIEQALRDAQIAPTPDLVDRLTREAARGVTGADLAEPVIPEEAEGLARQRSATPIMAYVPQDVVDDEIATETDPDAVPNPDPNNPNPPAGAVNLNQNFDMDDPGDNFSLPGISVGGLSVTPDQCPTWVLKAGTDRLDRHCVALEENKPWLRPIFFVIAVIGGLVSFRRG